VIKNIIIGTKPLGTTWLHNLDQNYSYYKLIIIIITIVIVNNIYIYINKKNIIVIVHIKNIFI